MSEKIVQLNEEVIKGELKDLVHGSVVVELFIVIKYNKINKSEVVEVLM